jgi:hypothetical protein
MRTQFLTIVLAVATLSPALGRAAAPEGWRLGQTDSSYAIERDTVVTYAGRPTGCLMSLRESKSFATMMQCIDAAELVGKRVRFSAYVKARGVKDWAGLWMRVDGPDPSTGSLAFDNMQNRPIKGTMDWKRCDVVLDVAKGAVGICLGALLGGEGRVWLGSVTFEVVDKTIPTTGDWTGMKHAPTNLDFSH